MWRRLVLLAMWPVAAAGLIAATPSRAAEVTPHPLLEKARARIQGVLAIQMPKAQVAVVGNRLTAEYHVRAYQLYPASAGGDFPEQPVPRRGPGKDGLLLTLELGPVPSGDVDPPIVPHEAYTPYWQTVVDRYRLRDRPEALSLTLLAGSRVSTQLLDTLRRAVMADIPPAPLEWKHPALRKAGTRLEALLWDKYPDARLRATPKGLYVEFRVRTFQVHGRYLTGEIQPEAHLDLGPEADGFLLGVTLQPDPYQGMAVVPQEYHEPYWTTHLNAVPLPATKEHLYLTLSYGSRTDRELIRKLKEAVSGE